MKTFDSFSFGCRVNLAEKEALDHALMEKGYVRQEVRPDIYILNTCAVTRKAEREARKHIHVIKRTYPSTKLVVTGCAATNWLKTRKNVKDIDFLIDNTSKEYIAEMIEKKVKRIDQPVRKATDILMRSKRAVIKIQDGCHRFCSFCIVPYLRGLPTSTPPETIIQRINEFAGYQEVILTAINTEAYGRDTGVTFPDLLKLILEKTTVPRISFGSIHPWTLDEAFFELYQRYAQSSRFVNFFHIPLQSGSNKILNLMKRGYTREEFIEKLNRLKKINEFAFIGTDIIVGFLEETDKDFEDTYAFLEQTPISRFHVFRYSRREHTAAYHLSKRLTKPASSVAKNRSQALRELSDRKCAAFQQKLVGKDMDALFLEKRMGGYQQVLLQNQIRAYVQSGKDFTGEIKHVRIKDYRKGQLFGTIT